jgi:hypothetical protein
MNLSVQTLHKETVLHHNILCSTWNSKRSVYAAAAHR